MAYTHRSNPPEATPITNVAKIASCGLAKSIKVRRVGDRAERILDGIMM